MTVTFDEITEFNRSVFRNIQGILPAFDEFDDLTTDPKAKAYAHRMTDTNMTFATDVLQYHAIDFVFDQTTWHATRFGDGTYPVWYGSVELQTAFYETLYHWHRTFINTPEGFSNKAKTSIKTWRTIFTVDCHAALIDLRKKCGQIESLAHPDPTHYPYTQQIGQRVHKEGYPGLLTKSARMTNGENIAVFRKTILAAPKHYGNYLYEYDIAKQRVVIKNQQSNELEMIVEQRFTYLPY